MSNDAPHSNPDSSKPSQNVPSVQKRSDFFAIPAPVKRVFDRFPLVTYTENELPRRSYGKLSKANVLHVFTTQEDAVEGRPSFNPGCLKWQVRMTHVMGIHVAAADETTGVDRHT